MATVKIKQNHEQHQLVATVKIRQNHKEESNN